jgi:hypothetical protein
LDSPGSTRRGIVVTCGERLIVPGPTHLIDMKAWRKNLSLAGLSLALSLGAVELLLAWLWPQPTMKRILQQAPQIYANSSILPYSLLANSSGRLIKPEFDTQIHINTDGYRGAELQARSDDRLRILAIGDSFTFGYGVEDAETYPARLQHHLYASGGDKQFEVINAGSAAGYYPDTYYLYLKEVGLQLKPDLIILGFFIGNDI